MTLNSGKRRRESYRMCRVCDVCDESSILYMIVLFSKPHVIGKGNNLGSPRLLLWTITKGVSLIVSPTPFVRAWSSTLKLPKYIPLDKMVKIRKSRFA